MDLPKRTPTPPPLDLRFRMMNLFIKLAPTGWKYWDNGVLFTTYTGNSKPVSVPAPYTWIWAGPEEIEFVDKHPEATSPTAYPRRAARGDRCLCLKKGSEVVSHIWVAGGTCCSLCGFGPKMEITFLPLKPGQAFSYDLFTYSAHRGRRLAILLIELMFQALRNESIKEVLSLVSLDNKPSLRLHLRLSAKPLHMTYGYRIRGWSRTFFGPERDPRLAQWLEQYRPVKRLTRHRPGNRGINR